MTTLNELKEPQIFDSTLTEDQKKQIKFKIYLNDQEGGRLITYWDFMNWLKMYHVSPDSFSAAQAEIGVPVEVPEGTVRFDRVSPTDDEVKKIMMAGITVHQTVNVDEKTNEQESADKPC